ncbi:hypothetical protein ACKTEK_10845 [Tepidamorphus sp. 3E244]|uniref:hypothetical protein n=1 Tax=Tepidamorphus sp. 3E244 TaxID=3385498 RepID=UPI0038FC97A1
MHSKDSYTHTFHALRGPRTYTLSDDALEWVDEGKAGHHRLPFSEISHVRLAYRPTRVQHNRYLAHITPRTGKRIDISNSSFHGYGSFTEHNEAYARFIRALHEKLAAHSSGTVFQKGGSWPGYIGNLVLTAWIALMLVIAALFLLFSGLLWIAVVKLAIIIFFLPTLVRFIIRAKPETYSPSKIPEGALPEIRSHA